MSVLALRHETPYILKYWWRRISSNMICEKTIFRLKAKTFLKNAGMTWLLFCHIPVFVWGLIFVTWVCSELPLSPCCTCWSGRCPGCCRIVNLCPRSSGPVETGYWYTPGSPAQEERERERSRVRAGRLQTSVCSQIIKLKTHTACSRTFYCSIQQRSPELESLSSCHYNTPPPAHHHFYFKCFSLIFLCTHNYMTHHS